jgi:hypothetical protein
MESKPVSEPLWKGLRPLEIMEQKGGLESTTLQIAILSISRLLHS